MRSTAALRDEGERAAASRVASALAGVVYPGFSPDGYLNLETIRSSIDWYAEKGLLKAKPKVSDLVDYQYLEYALGRIGRRGPPQKVE